MASGRRRAIGSSRGAGLHATELQGRDGAGLRAKELSGRDAAAARGGVWRSGREAAALGYARRERLGWGCLQR
ncbi:hypothetical protein ACP70R_000044 [Stipagrostis hirtigluma subsp. patula]